MPLKVTGPGIYPLDPVRRCERCGGTGKGPHCWGIEYGEPYWESCEKCNGTCTLGREDGPRVRIFKHHEGSFTAIPLGQKVDVHLTTFRVYWGRTPGLAYAAAQRAYEESKR